VGLINQAPTSLYKYIDIPQVGLMNQAPTSLYRYIEILQVGLMNQAPTIWKKVACPLAD